MLASSDVLHTSSLRLGLWSASSSLPSCSGFSTVALASPATSMMACVIVTSRSPIHARSARRSAESTTTATAITALTKQKRLDETALHCDCCEANTIQTA